METFPTVSRRSDLVDLSEDGAVDGSLVGAKAANLARARRAGLPVLPGLVLTTEWDHRGWSHPSRSEQSPARAAWETLGASGERTLVVRSSSTNEDGGSSSMAGVFESVLDVRTWPSFVDAVDRVLGSQRRADVVGARMAVLVQPQLTPRFGGVLFAADPVTGRTDRLLLAAVEGGPDRLVSGLDDGWTTVLSPRGRVLEQRGGDALPLGRATLRALARLAARASAAFGGPQDIEWAVDDDGTVWLLQSRPITTPTGRPGGPVLGTGPLAETFPEPLSTLESDLWLAPLSEGLEQALLLTGTASTRALRRRPVVRDIDGWAVADLGHLGVAPVRHKMLRRLDPRPPARRLRAAWRTGRLARALPALGRDVVEQIDRDLAEVPPIEQLANGALLAVLDNGRTALRALHGYEALAGMLVPDTGEGVTAASLALSALAEARAEGVPLDDVVETHPVVLALTPPRIGGAPESTMGVPGTIDLRDGAPTLVPAPVATGDEAVVREALRLRARWVQELTARAAAELGERLASVGVLPHADAVRVLELDELRAAARTRAVPADLADRIDPVAEPPRPLPARFRLTSEGTPVALAVEGGSGSVGGGGGTASGPVHVGDDPPVGAVLVVTHLDPRLAPVVSRLAGLVAETGSPLSHLAILAREHGVATVVGHAGAVERYAPGTVVEVDGAAGTVRVLDPVAPEPSGSPTVHAPDALRPVRATVVALTSRTRETDGDAAESPSSTVIEIGARR
jgi:rifampicin phosphotransferase